MLGPWIILALLSALFAALVAIFGKIGLGDIDTTLATTIRSIIMALFLVVLAISLGKFNLDKIEGKMLLFIALSGIAGALSWLFYFGALKLGPPVGVAAIDRLSLVFVLILTVLFLGESLTWKMGVGVALILFGSILLVLP
jgi:transporter family protein